MRDHHHVCSPHVRRRQHILGWKMVLIPFVLHVAKWVRARIYKRTGVPQNPTISAQNIVFCGYCRSKQLISTQHTCTKVVSRLTTPPGGGEFQPPADMHMCARHFLAQQCCLHIKLELDERLPLMLYLESIASWPASFFLWWPPL